MDRVKGQTEQLHNFGYRSGEYCVYKLICHLKGGRVCTMNTLILTKPVTSPSSSKVTDSKDGWSMVGGMALMVHGMLAGGDL